MTTNPAPRMRTSAPLTPEQIRAIVGAHEDAKRHRRYIKVRTVCRAAFWLAAGAGLLWVAGKTGVLDDYTNTCEALGKVCGKP